jgi:hypothetical protein
LAKLKPEFLQLFVIAVTLLDNQGTGVRIRPVGIPIAEGSSLFESHPAILVDILLEVAIMEKPIGVTPRIAPFLVLTAGKRAGVESGVEHLVVENPQICI